MSCDKPKTKVIITFPPNKCWVTMIQLNSDNFKTKRSLKMVDLRFENSEIITILFLEKERDLIFISLKYDYTF